MRKLFSILFVLSFAFSAVSQEKFPKLKPYVTDKTNFLTSSEKSSLEAELRAFEQETSNEIVIFITDDLYGYEKAEYAYAVAENNGIGKNTDNNGLFILIKPKTKISEGQIFIATGYGLEGAIPDAICNQIIDREIIPEFKKGRYFIGLKNALDILKKLAKGEIDKKQYQKSNKKESAWGFWIILILFFLIFNLFRAKKARRYSSMNGVPFWTAWTLMSAASNRGGSSFSNFSSGSGGFGGGGFGGFGGGSFGGGGAGGSW